MAFSPQAVCVSRQCLEGRDKGTGAGQEGLTYEIMRVNNGVSPRTLGFSHR